MCEKNVITETKNVTTPPSEISTSLMYTPKNVRGISRLPLHVSLCRPFSGNNDATNADDGLIHCQDVVRGII